MNKLNDMKNKARFKGVTFYKSKLFRVGLVLVLSLCVLNFGSSKLNTWKYGDVYAQTSNVGMLGGASFNGAKSADFMDSMDFTSSVAVPEMITGDIADVGYGSVTNDISEPVEEKDKTKLVYTSYAEVETKDIRSALDLIHTEIEKYNGILQSEDLSNMDSIDKREVLAEKNVYRGNMVASARLYVRIPQEVYKEFIEGMNNTDSDIIVVRDISQKMDNMTETYYDLDSRLKSLRTQETRLLEFMSSAENVADMLSVEERLSDVQYEIDRITNSINEIDNDVAYAKVTINIREVVKYTPNSENPQNFFERLVNYFSGSFESFVETMEDWLAVVIFLAPYIVLFAIVFVAVKKIVKNRARKKREKMKALENEIIEDNINKE